MRFSVAPSPLALPALPPAPSAAPSVLALSLHKAGSTLMFDMLRGLAPQAGLAFTSIQDAYFNQGIEPWNMPPEAATLIRPQGYCYGGFRGAPPFDIPILADARIAILVRDPRDIIVSEYYSVTRSHVVPKAQGEGTHFVERLRAMTRSRSIDEHALIVARGVEHQFDRYAVLGLFWRPNVALYRYEDVIFHKRDWVADLCRWYGWDIPEAARNAIADRHDILPDAADPAAHIRQVKPGNHRTELRPGTVTQLNIVFERWLRMFGYDAKGGVP